MIIDVILGVNIDTQMWIEKLVKNQAKNILVIDYDHYGNIEKRNNIYYISTLDAKNYLEKYDSVNFYKSLYCYPGMGGRMSSLYKSE